MKIQDFFGVLKQSGANWAKGNSSTLGAALAYYTAFSMAPLLIILIGIAGIALGHGAAQQGVFDEARKLIGYQGAKAVESMLQTSTKPSQGVVATILGIVTLLFGASGVFAQLQTSLNAVWEVEPKPGRGIWGVVKSRILSFGMILTLGFVLLVSLVLTTAISAAGKWFGNKMPGVELVGTTADFVFSLAVVTLLFALIFKYVPDVKIGWGDVWMGAAITAVLFTIGKYALGLYLGRSATTSSYGAAGSVLVLLLWVYYSAQILFFGAEFTQVYANRYGSKIEPSGDAVRVANPIRQENTAAVATKA